VSRFVTIGNTAVIVSGIPCRAAVCTPNEEMSHNQNR
jgi:hypothetical protein